MSLAYAPGGVSVTQTEKITLIKKWAGPESLGPEYEV